MHEQCYIGKELYNSVTKNCYQIGFIESPLSSFFFVTLASLFFFEDLFGYIPGISSHSQATKELCRSRCMRSKKQQTSPEMLVYRLSERRY